MDQDESGNKILDIYISPCVSGWSRGKTVECSVSPRNQIEIGFADDFVKGGHQRVRFDPVGCLNSVTGTKDRHDHSLESTGRLYGVNLT